MPHMVIDTKGHVDAESHAVSSEPDSYQFEMAFLRVSAEIIYPVHRFLNHTNLQTNVYPRVKSAESPLVWVACGSQAHIYNSVRAFYYCSRQNKKNMSRRTLAS